MEICQYHLDQLRDPDHAEGGRLFDRDVDHAAGKIVSGLSLQRLVELDNKTNAMLRSGQPVDGEFWDLVLKKIQVEKAVVSLDLNFTLHIFKAQCFLGQAQLDPRSGPDESPRAVQEASTRGRGESASGTRRGHRQP